MLRSVQCETFLYYIHICSALSSTCDLNISVVDCGEGAVEFIFCFTDVFGIPGLKLLEMFTPFILIILKTLWIFNYVLDTEAPQYISQNGTRLVLKLLSWYSLLF